jgi:predicted kinase
VSAVDAADSDAVSLPTLVVVTGRPGSGKTTLARLLSMALSCPLISRDEINDGIVRTHADDDTPPNKERVARITFDAFFEAIGLLVRAGATIVAEAAFQDSRWRSGLQPLLSAADIRVVRCDLDADVAYTRVVRRRAEQARTGRAVAAGTSSVSPTSPFVPLSLPIPALSVSTADDYVPGLDDILAFLTSREQLTPPP